MTTLKGDENDRSYHHGDLRNTLIQIGTEMLAESGEAALSLRKLAGRAGVSHNAPYQHFADKTALLAAIAEEGFRLLEGAMDEVTHGMTVDATKPEALLLALARAYVGFALMHPAHLQVMFSSFSHLDYPSLAAQSHQTLGQLIQAVGRVQGVTGQAAPPAQDVAVTAWVTMHGLSAILITGKIPPEIRAGRTDEQLTQQFVGIICRGLLNAPDEHED